MLQETEQKSNLALGTYNMNIREYKQIVVIIQMKLWIIMTIC